MRPSRWILPDPDARVEALSSALGLTAPAARVLCRRGFSNRDAAHRFLQPSLADLHDPFALRDMDRAAERLRTAIRGGEKILLYGDYDVDGTSSVVLLIKAIELAGGKADFHVPHRLQDGYGMRTEVVERAASEGVHLIVSVDTGIRAGEVVRRANELGIDVIVTDHHLPEAELPAALAVLNPNRLDCDYPEKDLCGAAVAFKLAQALLSGMPWPAEKLLRISESLLKLVAIATVADVVPLTGENRVIVKHGLSGLGEVRNPGLRALLDVAGFTGNAVPTVRDVAFRIAPRLNAAGRMDTARAVVEMFLTNDAAHARELAQQFHELNVDRQQVQAEISGICESITVDEAAAGLVYYDENWHRGVVGIVASRLVERWYRPVFVLGRNQQDGLAQGSGRSIPAFHLLEALEAIRDVFVRFGGHEHAAGVTLEASRIDEFRRRFNAYATERLRPEDLVARVDIDAVIELREINDRALADIFSLAPFGHGNPPPLFAALDVEIAGPPALWNEKHLKVMARQNGRTLMFKAWNFAGRAAELPAGSRVDLAFTLEEDPYTGWAAVLREVRSVGQASACGGL